LYSNSSKILKAKLWTMIFCDWVHAWMLFVHVFFYFNSLDLPQEEGNFWDNSGKMNIFCFWCKFIILYPVFFWCSTVTIFLWIIFNYSFAHIS
jgi:hypothetical protein